MLGHNRIASTGPWELFRLVSVEGAGVVVYERKYSLKVGKRLALLAHAHAHVRAHTQVMLHRSEQAPTQEKEGYQQSVAQLVQKGNCWLLRRGISHQNSRLDQQPSSHWWTLHPRSSNCASCYLLSRSMISTSTLWTSTPESTFSPRCALDTVAHFSFRVLVGIP